MQIGLEPLGVTQKLPVPPPVGNPLGKLGFPPLGKSVGKSLGAPVPGAGPFWPVPPPPLVSPPGPGPPSRASQTFHVPFCFWTSNSTLLVSLLESTMLAATVAELPFWVVLPIL